MKILTASEIREIDRLSTERYGIPGIVLMENAGMRVVEALEERFEDLADLAIGILCGKGNNGGDGFVVARQLIQKGYEPLVFLFAREGEVKGDARTNLDILTAIGQSPTVIGSIEDWEEQSEALLEMDILVDALLGTGLTKPVTGLYREVIDSVNERFLQATVISVDLPSGLAADSAHPVGPAVEADVTVTFTALKPCLVFAPAQENAGDVIVADIGNPSELVESDAHNVHLIGPDTFPAAAARRSEDTNKGNFGKVLVVAGSRGKSGAAVMTGQAALRVGAGLVTIATPESVLPQVAVAMPELMTEDLPETEAGSVANRVARLTGLLVGKSVLGIGPGMTTHPETRKFIRAALAESAVPTVIDADGLNSFVEAVDELKGDGRRPVIITPHPGEMARLIGKETVFVNQNRMEVAREFALSHHLYVVLKGFRTVVATPEGAVFVNPTGNPGMATAGTGDILTGMILGVLAQAHLGTLIERLCLAVHLHGAAGDLAAEKLGEEAMVATDILRFVNDAWEQLRQ
jgi:hydroxyethylthiazole kinase-like uncharacterized protein yjeF